MRYAFSKMGCSHVQEVGALLFAFYLTASTANIIFFLPLLLVSRYIFLKWVLAVSSPVEEKSQ